MAYITIYGAGQFGCALCTPLADNGHDVRLVGTHLDEAILTRLRTERTHPELSSPLPVSVQFYSDDQLDVSLAGADAIVLAVNSLGVDWAAMLLSGALPPGAPLLLASRGLTTHNGRVQTLADSLRNQLPQTPVVVLAGPALAADLVVRQPNTALLAGQNAAVEQFAAWLATAALNVRTSNDARGVTICAALSNVYALAVGLAGDDAPGAAASLFAQSLSEIAYLVAHLGGEEETVYGLADAGALYATAQRGRHRQLAHWLAAGLTFTDATVQHMPHATVEGAELALAVGAAFATMLRNGELDPDRLPLLRLLIDVICNDQFAHIPWDALLVS